MTLKTRRIIYTSLIIFFLIATPLVLAYSFGYSYDWQNKKIVRTGGFYLKSYPSGAKIFINDNQESKTPRLISRLLPKTYKIKILKNGFYPWEKELKIDSQVVTEARNILLIPEKPELKIIEEEIATDFSFEKYFLEADSLEKIEKAERISRDTLKSNSFFQTDNRIIYLESGSYLLYSADIDATTKEQISLSPLSAGDYKISSSGEFVLALKNEGSLFLLNPKTRIFDLIGNGMKNADFSPDGKKILYYTENEIWVKYLEKAQIQPYHEAGKKELITRFSEKIGSAIWYPEDNEHIIFTVGNTIKITELDGRHKRNTYDFIKADSVFNADSWKNLPLYYNTDKELLYFINNNRLYSAQIKTPQPIIETDNWLYGK